jgi:hypothetical protein
MAEPTDEVVDQPVDNTQVDDQVQTQVSDSPTETPTELPTSNQPDYDGRMRAFEERIQRAEQRNAYLEQTARLLAEEREQRIRQQQQPAQSNNLPPELEDLGKTLDPLFGRRIDQVTKPMVDTISRLYDEHDASKFEMYLMRNHPEVFDEEGGMDRIFQEVEAVRRQAAQTYNQWLSRTDAYLYAQGIRGVQTQMKTRKEKKTSQVRDEAKRVQSVRAATSNTQGLPPKRDPNAEIKSIREKLRAGKRLTDSERAKMRDFVGDTSF